MPFADYTFSQDSGDATAALSAISPISGIQSLRMTMPINSTAYYVMGYTAGLSKDCVEVRVLWRQSQGPFSIGVFAQMQGGGVNVNNTAYWCTLHGGSFGGTSNLVLNKTNCHNAMTNNVGLAFATVTDPGINGVCAIGLRCEHDTVSGAVQLTGLYNVGPVGIPVDTTYTYSGLAIQVQYLDTVSPYTSGSFGMGAFIQITGSTQDFGALYVDTD